MDAQLNDVSQQLTEVKVTGSKNKVFGMEERCRNYYWKERINFANNIKVSDDFTFRAICKWGSLVVVMINTTVTL
jgi:hypothetical protein